MQTLWKKYLKPSILVGILLASIAFLVQCGGVPKIPSLEGILEGEPPITTSISDAVTGVPFLDDFDPVGAIPLSMLARTSEGGFVIEHPGSYMFEAQSYCLAAGKYSPSGEYGYLYAPLKGPRSTVVKNVLKRSVNHPEIPQQDIQELLWAITSHTKISDMSPEMQKTAKKLLTQEEIYELNGGALGLIPEEFLDRTFGHLPPQVQQILEAEARLREMLTEGRATYDELEEVAVRFGSPPREEGDLKIPRGRWSFHPDGYFIRYFPDGYRRMLIELYVLESFQIEWDKQSRITLIADHDGNRIETDYDDTIEPLSISREASLKGYAFRSIRFVGPDPDNPGKKLRTEWKDIGWTFFGVPSEKGRIARFLGLKNRYEWAKTHKKEVIDLEQGVKKLRKTAHPGISQSGLEEIMALGHYAIALKEAIGKKVPENQKRLLDPINLVKRAWQSTFSIHMGTYKEKYVFNPVGDPVSGSKSEQPGQPSGRDGCRDSEAYSGCVGGAENLLNDCIDWAELASLEDMPFSEPDCNVDNLIDCFIKGKRPEGGPEPLVPGPPSPGDCAVASCKNLERIPEKDLDDVIDRLAKSLKDCLDEYKSAASECFEDNCK